MTSVAGPQMRRTGLPPLPLLPWGAHICLFHKSRQDLLDVVGDYISTGVADNECAVWAIPDALDRDGAMTSLEGTVPEVRARLDSGQLQIVPASEFYLGESQIHPERQMADWHRRLDAAIAAGWSGLRISSDTLWLQPNAWKSFGDFECSLTGGIAGSRIMVLCTYELGRSDALDLLDVAHWHQFSLLRRRGKWQIFEAPNLPDQKQELVRRSELLVLEDSEYPGQDLLTNREKQALVAIVRGLTNKEVARELGISPRTAEFHRANIMRKLAVRNLAELVAAVLT